MDFFCLKSNFLLKRLFFFVLKKIDPCLISKYFILMVNLYVLRSCGEAERLGRRGKPCNQAIFYVV